MRHIKRFFCSKWFWLLLLAALGGIVWSVVLPYRYTALALWGVAGTVGIYDLLTRLGRRRPVAARRIRRLFTGCLCLLLALMAVTAWLVHTGSRGAENPACDYVVVLGAGVNGTQPSPSLTERLEAALAYLQTYPQAQCVVSGGQGGGETITEAQCMETWAHRPGRLAGANLAGGAGHIHPGKSSLLPGTHPGENRNPPRGTGSGLQRVPPVSRLLYGKGGGSGVFGGSSRNPSPDFADALWIPGNFWHLVFPAVWQNMIRYMRGAQ